MAEFPEGQREMFLKSIELAQVFIPLAQSTEEETTVLVFGLILSAASIAASARLPGKSLVGMHDAMARMLEWAVFKCDKIVAQEK